jgi:hypothetical protein
MVPEKERCFAKSAVIEGELQLFSTSFIERANMIKPQCGYQFDQDSPLYSSREILVASHLAPSLKRWEKRA